MRPVLVPLAYETLESAFDLLLVHVVDVKLLLDVQVEGKHWPIAMKVVPRQVPCLERQCLRVMFITWSCLQ